MTLKRSEDIQPGDIILFHGNPHLVAHTRDRNGFGWPIARCADGWGITLCPGLVLEVATLEDQA